MSYACASMFWNLDALNMLSGLEDKDGMVCLRLTRVGSSNVEGIYQYNRMYVIVMPYAGD